MTKPRRCQDVWDGERCDNDALDERVGGKCAGCGKVFCSHHIVPDWHFCGWPDEERSDRIP